LLLSDRIQQPAYLVSNRTIVIYSAVKSNAVAQTLDFFRAFLALAAPYALLSGILLNRHSMQNAISSHTASRARTDWKPG